MFGIDATSTRNYPGLWNAGVRFCCRYLSHTPSKNLTADEARSLRAHGIGIVTVFESTGQTAKGGRAAGIDDARVAQAQLDAIGARKAPVFFAVDYDLQPHEYPRLEQYLGGAASVLGWKRVGLYAGYGPCHAAHTAGWCKWIWQTYGWSGGRWVKGVHIKQYSNGHILAGNSVDYDMAMTRNFGQWDPPIIPIPKPKPTYEVTVLSALNVPVKMWVTRFPLLSQVRRRVFVRPNQPHEVDVIRR